MKGRVVWVVDGDTVHVQLGRRVEKVRYIGVNAPEIPHPQARGWHEGGAQAFEVNRQLMATAQRELTLALEERKRARRAFRKADERVDSGRVTRSVGRRWGRRRNA